MFPASDRYTMAPSVRRVLHCANGCAHLDAGGCCSFADPKGAAWRRNYKPLGEMPDADAPGCPSFTPK